MSLTLTLNNALSGLQVNQQALSVLSQNIANANTAGYSRQVVDQQPVYIGDQGSGVAIENVLRKVDQYLVATVRGQNSSVGQNNIISDYNSRIQIMLGQPGSSNSIDGYINAFFNNLQSLAQTPQNSTLQQTAVNSAVNLASQVQQLAQGLYGLQAQADSDIKGAVDQVNTDLTNLEQVNNAIAVGLAAGQSVAGLQDKRDGLLNDIAQYMNIQVFSKADGSYAVTAGNGVTLLDGTASKLTYAPSSAAAFANGSTLSPLTVTRYDGQGNVIGTPVALVTAGTPSTTTTTITSGKVAGLLAMRDQQIPDIVSQLDLLASSLRDQVNAIHNNGTSFPGAASLTGTRAVTGQDFTNWSGSVRIAVLGSDGQPLASPYADEPNGVPPLTLDLSAMNTGSGTGNPSVQGIIDAINQYYGQPRPKAELGNINNIQLVSDSQTIPNSSSQLSFDFNLQNLSASPSNFYVTGLQVKDSSGADITSITQSVPTVALAAVNTYQTTSGSSVVTVHTAGANPLTNGQTVYLSAPPAGVYSGIDASKLGGYFTISNVTANSFDITVSGTGDGTSSNVAGQTATPPYASVDAGGTVRTLPQGAITADLSGNVSSPYYTVIANVGVDDGSGTIKTSQITYQVPAQSNGLNNIYGAQAMTGNGTLVQPNSNLPLAQASLVDASGKEIAKLGGKYANGIQGFLKIQALNSNSVIAIDSLDSQQLGQPNDVPPQPGTGRGFSYYFDLNDFFQSNKLTSTGDTVVGSAASLAVEQRLKDNPGLLSLGSLIQGSQPTPGSKLPPNYTYERNPGDNSIVTQLAALGSATLNFVPTGGIGATSQSLSGYAGAIVGGAATAASNAKTNQTNAQTLLDGYTKQASSVSGVNLDTELANTVIYQNAYAASARVITVTSTLFDALLQTFQ